VLKDNDHDEQKNFPKKHCVYRIRVIIGSSFFNGRRGEHGQRI